MEMFRSMLAPLHFVCFLSLWTHQSHLIKHILFPSIFAFRTESCRRLWWFQHCWRRIEQGAKIEGVQNKKSNWKYCLSKHPEPQIWWNFDQFFMQFYLCSIETLTKHHLSLNFEKLLRRCLGFGQIWGSQCLYKRRAYQSFSSFRRVRLSSFTSRSCSVYWADYFFDFVTSVKREQGRMN